MADIQYRWQCKVHGVGGAGYDDATAAFDECVKHGLTDGDSSCDFAVDSFSVAAEIAAIAPVVSPVVQEKE